MSNKKNINEKVQKKQNDLVRGIHKILSGEKSLAELGNETRSNTEILEKSFRSVLSGITYRVETFDKQVGTDPEIWSFVQGELNILLSDKEAYQENFESRFKKPITEKEDPELSTENPLMAEDTNTQDVSTQPKI